MPSHPYDTLCRAASLIRWNQRLLCDMGPETTLNLSPEEANGLYWTFEEILEDIAEVLETMEKKSAA